MEKFNTSNNYDLPDEKNILQNLFLEDYQAANQKLESIEHRIAERKKLELLNIEKLERQRKKLEDMLNDLPCPELNPGILSTRATLGTEMVRVQMKKGEEAVNAFRDVERLEDEKRKLLEELCGEKSLGKITGGFT